MEQIGLLAGKRAPPPTTTIRGDAMRRRGVAPPHTHFHTAKVRLYLMVSHRPDQSRKKPTGGPRSRSDSYLRSFPMYVVPK